LSYKAKQLNLKREWVRCALCGRDDTKVKFKIRSRDSKLSSVWVNGIQHQIDDTEIIVICRACGLVYVNPRLASGPDIATYSIEQELAYFEGSRDVRLSAYRDLVRRLPHWLGRDVQTLLDVGCGDGVLVEVARQAGIESMGSEISDTLIRLVRERLGEEAIIPGDLAELPVAQYDVITLINVLEHLRNPGKMLETSNRLLKPGGITLVHVPNLGGLPAKLYGARWHQIEPLEHFYYFTAKTLRALMRKAELEPVGRFSLIVSKGLRGKAQCFLGGMGVYLDSGLGIVARRPFQGGR
jgi:2-polyprenyl-3-methyl-5-hydroxy-6-metoxy-1,4-benzoquinol methylase